MHRGRAREARGAVTDLSKIIKAYDIRGVVPDELNEDVAEAAGAAFIRLTGAGEIVITHDMRTSSPPLVAAFARGATAQGADVIDARSRFHRHALLRERHARHPGRHDYRQPQPVPLQRHQAVPGRGEAGRPADRPGRAARDDRGGRARQRRPGRAGDPPGSAVRLRGAPEEAGRPVRHPAAEGRGRRRQRHGRVHRAEGLRRAADQAGADVLRAGRHLPEPRGQPDRPGEPARPAAGGDRDAGRHRARLRRRRRPLFRRRRAGRDRLPVGAHRAHREPRTGP